MSTTTNRDWIATEFSKGIDAERDLAAVARARAASPPDSTLAVLYHEIAEADERHRAIVETIATRYGHTPSKATTGGLAETIGRLKEKVSELGTAPHERLGQDLAAKANAIHWCTAWVHTFETIGDTESARELATVLTEEKAHRDALQEGLNRLVERGATSAGDAKPS
ncbi:MAG: hypothetical protein IRY99_25585 [Isosphaeraceae bacterium]|nr:hypothetical protein [Isosphaeraceae bacterium]